MLEWSEFAQRFARELAALPRDTILIVREREEIRHYVQAMWEPDRLYAEAVSNNFLDGPLLLTPADEEVLTEAGWRPPAPQVSGNWWTELPPTMSPADFAMLSDMMVTALRDVQGVRRPADLAYESFRRLGTGLIELADFGIGIADPSRVTERLSSQEITESRRAQSPALPLTAPVGEPTGELEERLGDAKQRGDHMAYFELLLSADLVLPATGQAVEDPSLVEFTATMINNSPYVLVFTSPQAMGSGGTHQRPPALYRKTTFGEIAAALPGLAGEGPAWSLAINLGQPSEIHLDAATVARLDDMRRTAEQAATVDALVDPAGRPGPGVAMRLPHGAQLWRLADARLTDARLNETGLNDTGLNDTIGPAGPMAVYDAMNGGWTLTVAGHPGAPGDGE